ncbi:MAG: response regulator transcription factor, partial [Candidatus Xenobia bacterium]
MESRVQVLVVEDEAKVAAALRDGLATAGFSPMLAGTCGEALARLQEQRFEVVVLDLNLPDRDGLDCLGSLRKAGIATPVLVLTARDAVSDRVRGLDCGADDYLIKPFAFDELLARLRALVRRGRAQPTLLLHCGSLVMDLVTRRVQRGSTLLDLTTREFELL